MVREVMTPDVLYCFETQDVERGGKMMTENQIRRLFVLNEDEELVGITSLGELATVTGDRAMAGATLERKSEPAAANQKSRKRLKSSHRREL